MDECFTIVYTFEVKVYFVKIVDLVGLAYPVADHVGCSNYATTYADN